jgi:hypothetical protein
MRRQQTVWVCRASGTKFWTREEFREHLLQLRDARTSRRRRERLIATGEAFAKNCRSIEELENWLDTGGFIGSYAALRDRNAVTDTGNFKFTGIRVGACSNSHSAPAGMPTNWGGQNRGAPRSYPGISCHISFSGSVKSEWYVGVSDVLKVLGICTGTGGSGNGKKYSYDCIVWAAHFPKLYDRLLALQLAKSIGIDAEGFSVESA